MLPRVLERRINFIMGVITAVCMYIVRAPVRFVRFILWLPYYITDDFDPSLIILYTYILTMVFFFVAYLYKATNYLQQTRDFIIDSFYGTINFTVYSFYFVQEYYLYILMYFAICAFLIYQVHLLLKREQARRVMFLEEANDPFVDTSIQRIENERRTSGRLVRGWGEKAYTHEDEHFVAPSVCAKIRGMYQPTVGVFHDEIRRINQEVKAKLTIDSEDPLPPWKNLIIETDTAIVFVLFHNIEQATEAFRRLNGCFFDG